MSTIRNCYCESCTLQSALATAEDLIEVEAGEKEKEGTLFES